MALADYRQQVSDLVRDVGGVIDAAAQERAIAQAVAAYGSDLPRTLVEELNWPAAGVFGPAPVQWREGAWLKGAWHLAGAAAPRPLHAAVVRVRAGWQLEVAWPLPPGAVVRVDYTAAHQVGATADTVPEAHRGPVAMLAASLLCLQLATYYSGQRETAVGADASSTETRSREYAARAREYRNAYYVGTGQVNPWARSGGAAGSGVQAAASVGHWPGRERGRLFVQGDGA